MQLYLKETPTQVFSCEICEIFKSTYSDEHLKMPAFDLYSNSTESKVL